MIVLWTANTERFCDVQDGLNDTAENLLNSIAQNEEEVSPSTIFAVASILEKVNDGFFPFENGIYSVKLKTLFFFYFQCSYINGSPQNTNVPGVIDLAKKYGTFLGGDDFKSGQTKMKSVLVDFLVSAGIKVMIFTPLLQKAFGLIM